MNYLFLIRWIFGYLFYIFGNILVITRARILMHLKPYKYALKNSQKVFKKCILSQK
jgi:hypothetical protein